MKKELVFEKVLHTRKSHTKAEYINLKIPPNIFMEDELYIIKFYRVTK